MPISDLLASITGEKAGPSSTPAPRPVATVPKRKADDELRSAPLQKTPRIESAADRFSRPNSNSPKPADKPAGSSINKPAPTSRSTSNNGSAARASASSNVSSNGARTAPNGSKPLPARPVVSRPTPPPASSGPPKARSFAEIMARAKANAEVRESLGKINHKPLERNLTMKERKELKAEEARKGKTGARKPALGRSGPAAGPSVAPSRATPTGAAKRNGVSPGVSSGKKGAPVEEDKKVKKAATATTGYTGTARPRPGAKPASKPGSAARSEEPDKPRANSRYGYGAPRRGYDRRDGYDRGEDLDDFIEYDDDDDEAGYGNRGGYSDESDMEAGLSDIEDEETAAERRAREEDKREEALEKRLKREKEERKRRLLDQNRARAGNR